MAGTATISTIKHDVTGAATRFNDGSGNEIGRLMRSWINYTGSTQVVNGSFNVSSVTKSSTGTYVNNFSTALPSSTYSATASNNSWACFISVSATTSYTIGSYITTSGSAADYQVFGMATA